MSSLIVSWSSINLLFENSSIRYSWTLFNSSISWRLLIRASRRSRICSDSCSRRSCWSCRDCSSLAIVWSISLRWESIIPVNSWILLLSESAWNSCFWISALKSARICSFCLSRRILILSFSLSRLDFRFGANFVHLRVSPYLSDTQERTELATNFLHKSDKLVSGLLVLLAPEWTVVKIALFRWSHRRVPHRTSTKAPYLCRRTHPGRSLQKSLSSRSCRGGLAHNLWEGCVSQLDTTPHCAGAHWV